MEWPSDKPILNRTSFDNFGPDNGEGANRFAFNLTSGSGEVFRGFIGRHNIDDIWGMFTWNHTGSIGAVMIVTISFQIVARLQAVIDEPDEKL